MQKFTKFVKKSLKKNMLKIRNIVKLETIDIIHNNIEVVHIVYVIESIATIPKGITIIFIIRM